MIQQHKHDLSFYFHCRGVGQFQITGACTLHYVSSCHKCAVPKYFCLQAATWRSQLACCLDTNFWHVLCIQKKLVYKMWDRSLLVFFNTCKKQLDAQKSRLHPQHTSTSLNCLFLKSAMILKKKFNWNDLKFLRIIIYTKRFNMLNDTTLYWQKRADNLSLKQKYCEWNTTVRRQERNAKGYSPSVS